MLKEDSKTKLAKYKAQIDNDIDQYVLHLQTATSVQYGQASRQAIDAFTAILQRGGKRIRGALTMQGYQMMGGQDEAMILQAARAIEMLHAYLLIIDDIQDRSASRRGGPAAHIALSHDYGGHYGQSLATNAALLGNHAAQTILANLEVEPLLRSNVLSIVNRTLLVTLHGQINDLSSEANKTVNLEEVENVMAWKTANYSFLNPLHVGMVLAGADCRATDAITEYALQAGRAFQITDDLIGVFGSQEQTGKNPMDDIREGKRTLLTVYALNNCETDDGDFLRSCLGNQELTQKNFERCQEILVNSGAQKYALSQAELSIEQAAKSLRVNSSYWSPEGTKFLKDLAQSLSTRFS